MNLKSKLKIKVKNYQLIVDHFGYWPDFHDAEILKTNYKKRQKEFYMRIHAFEISKEKDPKGNFKTTKHCEITLIFTHANIKNLHGWADQNIILYLDFQEHEDGILTELHASIGLCGDILSKNIEIRSVKAIK